MLSFLPFFAALCFSFVMFFFFAATLTCVAVVRVIPVIPVIPLVAIVFAIVTGHVVVVVAGNGNGNGARAVCSLGADIRARIVLHMAESYR